MHRHRIALFPLLALVPVAAACSGSDGPEASEEFCEAAATYDTEVGTGDLSSEEQVDLVTTMAESAPAEIRDDAEVFLRALESVADGDKSVIDDPEIEDSVDNVNRFASKACDLLEGNSPYG
ncbi:MAG: hypothetical protein R3A49_09535 [Acidimicrobiia bacterium]